MTTRLVKRASLVLKERTHSAAELQMGPSAWWLLSHCFKRIERHTAGKKRQATKKWGKYSFRCWYRDTRRQSSHRQINLSWEIDSDKDWFGPQLQAPVWPFLPPSLVLLKLRGVDSQSYLITMIPSQLAGLKTPWKGSRERRNRRKTAQVGSGGERCEEKKHESPCFPLESLVAQRCWRVLTLPSQVLKLHNVLLLILLS